VAGTEFIFSAVPIVDEEAAEEREEGGEREGRGGEGSECVSERGAVCVQARTVERERGGDRASPIDASDQPASYN